MTRSFMLPILRWSSNQHDWLFLIVLNTGSPEDRMREIQSLKFHYVLYLILYLKYIVIYCPEFSYIEYWDDFTD